MQFTTADELREAMFTKVKEAIDLRKNLKPLERETYTLQETAELTGWTVRNMRELLLEGLISDVGDSRFARRKFIPKADVQKLIDYTFDQTKAKLLSTFTVKIKRGTTEGKRM